MVRIFLSHAFFVPLKEKTWHYSKNIRTIRTQLPEKGLLIGNYNRTATCGWSKCVWISDSCCYFVSRTLFTKDTHAQSIALCMANYAMVNTNCYSPPGWLCFWIYQFCTGAELQRIENQYATIMHQLLKQAVSVIAYFLHRIDISD